MMIKLLLLMFAGFTLTNCQNSEIGMTSETDTKESLTGAGTDQVVEPEDSLNNQDVLSDSSSKLLNDLNELTEGQQELQTQIDNMKVLVATLEKKYDKDIADLKATDVRLENEIKSLRADLDALEERVVSNEKAIKVLEDRADANDKGDQLTLALFKSFQAEFMDLKSDYMNHVDKLEGVTTLVNSNIQSLQGEIKALKEDFNTKSDMNEEEFAKLREEFNAKNEEYADLIAGLKNQQVVANEAIQQVQDEAIKRALEAEHAFAVKISEMAMANKEMIDNLGEQVANIDLRVTDLSDAFDKSLEFIHSLADEVEANTVEIAALANKNETNAEIIRSNTARIQALEFFQNVQKFCAGAATALNAAQKDVIGLQRTNRVQFGPSEEARNGFGNAFAKLSRFKAAEELFDRYYYNRMFIENTQQQIEVLQSSCSAMLAFPGRPEAGDSAVVGITPSPVEGGDPTRWSMIDHIEARRLFRLLPDVPALRTADVMEKMNKIIVNFDNIYESGQSISGSDWDRHFLGLVMLVANGLELVKQSIAYAKTDMISDAAHERILPDNQHSNLCRFGNGSIDRSDADGLRYSDIEAAYHLPQQYYYQKRGKDVFMISFNYKMGMGPSAEQVENLLKSTDGLDSVTNSSELFSTASDLNDYAKYPTVVERNVNYYKTGFQKNISTTCADYGLSRYGFRSAYLPRIAHIPFKKSGSCWAENVSSIGTVCSKILFNPEGEEGAFDLEKRRSVAFTKSNVTKNTSENLEMKKFTKANYPNAKLASDSDSMYVVELYTEAQKEKYATGGSNEICHDEARFATDIEYAQMHARFGTLMDEISLNGETLLRNEKSIAAPVKFIARACAMCDTNAAVSKTVMINGEIAPSKYPKLRFAPDFLFPMTWPGTEDNYRCVITPSRCNDYCSMLDLNGDNLPDGGKGIFKMYGNADNPGEPILRNVSNTTGVPWAFDVKAMVNKDTCECSVPILPPPPPPPADDLVE